MPLLDDYLENTEIFKPHQNLIDPAAFKAMAQQHGIQFAKGYLKCLHEITEIVANIIVDPEVYTETSGRQYRVNESQPTAYGKLWHLHKALYKFIQENGLPVGHIAEPFIHGTKAQSF